MFTLPTATAALELLLVRFHQLLESILNLWRDRQLYFKAQQLIGKYDLESEYKGNKHYKALHSHAAQQVLRSVAELFESFKKLKAAFYQGKISDKPRLPNYRKSGGMAVVTYPKQA